MNLLRKLLWPLTPLYYLGALINKKFYDWNIKKSVTYDFPLITVGNLSVGGTGKSPMVAYILELILNKKRVASLSRGYKRSTKGFQLVNKNHTALQVGDEPLQFKRNYPECIVAVDEDRRNGIQTLIELERKPEVIILDDAFQHRKVKAGLQILLTAYYNLYVDDWLLPSGDLREPISGAERADIIVVTKCPNSLSKQEQEQIKRKLKLKRYQHLFFTSIQYSDFVKNGQESISLENYITSNFTLVTGIANPDPLINFLKNKKAAFNHLRFADHHNFTDIEIEKIAKEERILTTEKDFMRLRSFDVLKGKLFYLPIKVSFITGKESFENRIIHFTDRN